MNDLEALFSVNGKTALVTGGATGLGRICAETLVRAGARVLIASRKADQCRAAAAELSALGECEGFGADVASEAGVAALAREVGERAPRLDILVNNSVRPGARPSQNSTGRRGSACCRSTSSGFSR